MSCPPERLLMDLFCHFDIDTVTHEIILSFLGKSTVRIICFAIRRKISYRRGYERAFGCYLSGKDKSELLIHKIQTPASFLLTAPCSHSSGGLGGLCVTEWGLCLVWGLWGGQQ